MAATCKPIYFYLKDNFLQQPNIQAANTGKYNCKTGMDTANIIQLHDIDHAVTTVKTYLATDNDYNKVTGKEKQEAVFIHDFFGALNY